MQKSIIRLGELRRLGQSRKSDLNNGWNANQWANISKVGVMLGYKPMYFFAPLSQYQACLGNDDPSCPYTDNTPLEAWTQLLNALNTRPETAQNYIPYMTDIDWP